MPIFLGMLLSTSYVKGQVEIDLSKSQAGASTSKTEKEVGEGYRSGVLIPICLMVGSPLGQLAVDYGNFGGLQVGAFYKSKSNFLIGADFSYFSSGDVRPNPLRSLQVANGVMIGADGANSEVGRSFRSLILPVIKAGYTFRAPIGAAADKSSGINMMMGVGYWGHRIRYADQSRNIPFLQSEYYKGYDRLAHGTCLQWDVSYHYLSENRTVNFLIGLSYTYGFLKERRYDYERNIPAGATRNDQYLSVRLGWILPVYGQRTREMYYY